MVRVDRGRSGKEVALVPEGSSPPPPEPQSIDKSTVKLTQVPSDWTDEERGGQEVRSKCHLQLGTGEEAQPGHPCL